MNPKAILEILEKNYNIIKNENDKNYITLDNNKNYYFTADYKSITSSLKYYRYIVEKGKTFDPLLWSEKIFQIVYNQSQEFLTNKEKLSEVRDKIGLRKKSNTTENYEYYESILLDIDNLDLVPSLLIFENDENQINLLLSSNFDGGALICGAAYSIPYVILDFYKKIPKRKFRKTSKKELSIDHPIFKSLSYLKSIDSGDFQIVSNTVQAKFILKNGEIKEETLTVNFDD